MALTRQYLEKTLAHAIILNMQRGLLEGGRKICLSGDVESDTSVICNFISAKISFESLAGRFSKDPRRMFGPSGNPQANNFFTVIRHL